MNIELISALEDNYIFVIHDADSGFTAVVDPAEAAPVLKFLDQKGWVLTHILNTHHHFDHIGGNLELKRRSNCLIVGASHDSDRIPGIDIFVSESDPLVIGKIEIAIIDVPGHTLGHICYFFAKEKVLFAGDTLFNLGCGRVFEGTPLQMYQSLEKIKSLPSDSWIYCAHEYTLRNGEFALTIDPENEDLKNYLNVCRKLRLQHRPTVPTRLMDQLAANPFLRANRETIKTAVGLTGKDDWLVFAELRRRRNQF